jgi:hypothetical protein
MLNSWFLMSAGKTSTRISPLKCEKLNVRSYVLVSTLKIVALRIFGSDNVMVPSVNKSDFVVKSISSSFFSFH